MFSAKSDHVFREEFQPFVNFPHAAIVFGGTVSHPPVMFQGMHFEVALHALETLACLVVHTVYSLRPKSILTVSRTT